VAAVVQWLLFVGLMFALLFGSAGRLDLPWVWAYLAVCSILTVVAVLGIDRDLARERLRPGPGGADRLFPFAAQFLGFAHWIISGLDVGRFHGSSDMPFALRVAGLIGLASFAALGLSAMVINPFFSPLIRLQEERGHRLVARGPYRIVRHPGYAGWIGACLFSGLALGSWWSLAPMAGIVLLTIRRTVIEDAFLRERLPGYDDYAQRVSYRLIPGIY